MHEIFGFFVLHALRYLVADRDEWPDKNKKREEEGEIVWGKVERVGDAMGIIVSAWAKKLCIVT